MSTRLRYPSAPGRAGRILRPVGIRAAANLFALVALTVGILGSAASSSSVFHWLFLGGFLFLLVSFYGGWIRRGQDSSYQEAEDLRRADDEGGRKPSMLGRYWPGPS